MKQKKIVFAALVFLAVIQLALFLALSNSRPFFDEGIYLTGGWLFSKGILPYSGFFESKPIGIFAVGALLFHVSASLLAARVFMALAAVASMALVFLIAKKALNEKAGLVSASFFVFAGLVFGNFWFLIEPIVALLALVSVYCYMNYSESRKAKWLATAVLSVSLAVWFKQTAILIAALFLVFFLYNEIRLQKKPSKALLSFIESLAPAILVYAMVFAFLLLSGSFHYFWQYLFGFHSQNLSYYAQFVLSFKYLPVLAAIALPFLLLIALLAKKTIIDAKQAQLFFLLLLWLVGSTAMLLPLLGCCMHFIPMLPVFAIFSGIAFSEFWKKGFLPKAVSLLVLIAIIFGGLFYAYQYSNPENSFNDLNSIAAKIRSASSPNEKILVLPATPELYFLGGREPATKALYFEFIGYPADFLLEEIQRLSNSPPKIVIVFSADGLFAGNGEIPDFVKQNYSEKEKIALQAPLYGTYYYALWLEKK